MVSDTLKEAVFSQQTDEAFIRLLTIDGEDIPQPIRVASDPMELLPVAGVRGVISRSNEYIYLPMEIILPQQDDTGVSRARISIDNIDRRIVEGARNTTKSMSVTIEIVLSSDPDTVEVSIPDFKFERVRYNAMTISGEISLDFFDTEPLPKGRFTPSKWPGIF